MIIISRTHLKEEGFSLLEVIIAAAILGVIASIVGYYMVNQSKLLNKTTALWKTQNDLGVVITFITKQARNATNMDLTASPGSPVGGYCYIYLDSSTGNVKYIDGDGATRSITNVVADSLSFEIRKDVGGNNFLSYAVGGSAGGQARQIASEVVLNNISDLNPVTGNVLCYNSSSFTALPDDGKVMFAFPACKGASSVKLQKSTVSATQGFTDTGLSLDGNSTSAVVTGLTNGAPYWFKLVVTGGPNAGNYLAQAKPAIPTRPVADLTASVNKGKVNFNFSAPSGATAVLLRVSSTSPWSGFTDTGVNLGPASTSATVTGLTPGRQYWFKLVVRGGAKAGDSNTVTVTL